MHARTPEGVIDYEAFFSFLASRSSTEWQTSVGDEIVAITSITTTSRALRLRFVRGQEGIPPLTYDPDTGEESYEEIGRRVLVYSTWAFFDPKRRLAAIERRRPGVGVNQIALALSHLGRELGFADRLTFSLNPVTDKAFIDELNNYERIREAEVELARPNFDWSDNAGPLTDYAAESNAGTAAVRLTAQRGDSLEQSEGIVEDIRGLVASRFSALRNARILGRRHGEDRETSLSLRRFQTKRFASVPDDASPSTEAELIEGAAALLIDELAVDDHEPVGE
jgi:hypothetical protein